MIRCERHETAIAPGRVPSLGCPTRGIVQPDNSCPVERNGFLLNNSKAKPESHSIERAEMSEEKKPELEGLFRDNPETPEGKYLVKRRDGSVVEWPSFVLGARDEAAQAALLAYAAKGRELGFNSGYCDAIERLAGVFGEYRRTHGQGDPDKGKHRKDDPATIAEMRKGKSA